MLAHNKVKISELSYLAPKCPLSSKAKCPVGTDGQDHTETSPGERTTEHEERSMALLTSAVPRQPCVPSTEAKSYIKKKLTRK